MQVISLHCEVLTVLSKAASTFWACYPTTALNEMVHNRSKVRQNPGVFLSWYGNHHRNLTVYILRSCTFNSERYETKVAASNAFNSLYFTIEEAQTPIRCPHISGRQHFQMTVFLPSRAWLQAYTQWAIRAHLQKNWVQYLPSVSGSNCRYISSVATPFYAAFKFRHLFPALLYLAHHVV